MKRLVCAVLLLAATAAAQSKPVAPAPNVTPQPSAKSFRQPMPRECAWQLAKQYSADMLAGRGSQLWPEMTVTMQAAVGGERSKYDVIAESIPKQIGHIVRSSQERMLPSLELQVYSEEIRTDGFSGPLVVSVALDPDGKIAGMGVRPLPNTAPTKFLDYQDKTAFRFPLEGEWTIYQGGESVYDNYHAESSDQRFAMDIVHIENGSLFSDAGSSLTAFYGFGKPVFAAAAGKVVSADDSYDDNPVGAPAANAPKQGNNVVIDHGNGEFSMYAHLRRGSITVKAGDHVKAGELIAQVGNSGNSPLPHLHFHVQNSPTWFQGEGLPVLFHDMMVNGEKLSEASPVRGDRVRAQ